MNSSYSLPAKALEEWTGTDGDDVHEVGTDIIGRFDGGAGNDTLRIKGTGWVRLYSLDITSIETIEGASGGNNFHLGSDTLPKIKHIKGGAGHNSLYLWGADFDLTTLILSNIHEITYTMGAPSRIVVPDFETAMLIKASPYHPVFITLKTGTFTDSQKAALYGKGLMYLRDEAGDHINPRPLMNNFHNDKVHVEAGVAALLDQGTQLTLQGESSSMKSLIVRAAGFHDISDVYGIEVTASGGVTLSDALAKGVDVLVGGTVIGSVVNLSTAELEIAFNSNASVARVQEVMRALTFTNTDPLQVTERQIEVIVTDPTGRTDRALINATVAPLNTQFQIPGEWGGADKGPLDNFSVRSEYRSAGFAIKAGKGDDTVFLSGGGIFDFKWNRLKDVEFIRGSNRNDDITFSPESIEDVWRIDLRGQATNDYDIVRLDGAFFDISGVIFESVDTIELVKNNTVIGLDSITNARMINGRNTTNDHIILTNGIFSAADIAALRANGIEHITDQNGPIPASAGSPTPGDSGGSKTGQTLIGTKAKNTLSGGAGNDQLYGKSGNDLLTGGAGADFFVFDTALGKGTTKKNQNKKVNFDTITDFKPGEDKILLDNAIFKKLGKGSEAAPGSLKKSLFKKNKATDKDDFLVYKGGVVFYDADGNGTKFKPVEVIKIANKAALSAADFLII